MMLLRGVEQHTPVLVQRTERGMHTETCPRQLGTRANKARDAHSLLTEVHEGDMLIVCSDGVFDNIGSQEIMELVCSNRDLLAIAEDIGTAAYNTVCGRGPGGGLYASKHSSHKGGKPDDITCVVAQVIRMDSGCILAPAANVVYVQHRGVGKL